MCSGEPVCRGTTGIGGEDKVSARGAGVPLGSAVRVTVCSGEPVCRGTTGLGGEDKVNARGAGATIGFGIGGGSGKTPVTALVLE